MSSSKEEDFSDDDLVNVFGESEDEDDFVGFNFTLPDDIHWETRRFVDFMMTILPRYFAATMLVRQSKNYLVRSDLWILSSSLSAMNFWKKIARWTNDWFQVKKASEPNKHKAPFEPITDINELKAYFGILLAVNQNIEPPPLWALLPSRRIEMASPSTGFHKVF